MNNCRAVFLLISMCIGVVAHAESVKRIDVFVDSALDINESANLHVWDLSLPEKTKAHYLPAHFSADPQAAKQQLISFMNSPQGNEFKQAMKDSYAGFVEMTKLRVQKTPAIVINQKFVIYGTTDVDAALNDYRLYTSSRN